MGVRHSATGGWPGTYVGKLTRGGTIHNHHHTTTDFTIDDNDDDITIPSSLSSYSHSSIVRDSLFVDYDTATPTLGGGGRNSNEDSKRNDDSDDNDSWGGEDNSYLGPLSYRDNRRQRDPWGKEII